MSFAARLSVALAFLMLCAGAGASRAESIYDGPSIGSEALFKSGYRSLRSQKALAVGPGASWGYAYGFSTSAEAIAKAIETCNQAIPAEMVKAGHAGKCRAYADGDRVVWSGPEPGGPIDEPEPGEDVPLRRAEIFRPTGDPKAVVLFLHGCDELYLLGWVDTWIQYFNARGFLFIAPSSYHERRPASVCDIVEYTNDRETVYRTRTRQTLRSIAALKRQHPALPLYVWGHSEGGLIAQAIRTDVTGIIVTGAECGVFSPEGNMVPQHVPMLYLFGERDPYLKAIAERVTPADITRYCGQGYSGLRSWSVVGGIGHFPAIWRQEVMTELSRFIGTAPFDTQAAPEEALLPETDPRRKTYETIYLNLPMPRAIAIGPNGAIGMASGFLWDDVEDARQAALVACDKLAAKTAAEQPFAPGGRHLCRIYALDRKATDAKQP